MILCWIQDQKIFVLFQTTLVGHQQNLGKVSKLNKITVKKKKNKITVLINFLILTT